MGGKILDCIHFLIHNNRIAVLDWHRKTCPPPVKGRAMQETTTLLWVYAHVDEDPFDAMTIALKGLF